MPHSRPFARRPLRGLALAAAAAAAAASLALGGCGEDAPPGAGGAAAPDISAVTGAFSRPGPGHGGAVFSGPRMGPGRSVSGGLTVSNSGGRTGIFRVRQSPIDVTTRGGAKDPLAGLSLFVLDLTAPLAPATLYAGSAADFGSRPVGPIAPGHSRAYSFTLTANVDAPTKGTVKVRYDWSTGRSTTAARPPGRRKRPSGAPLRVSVRVPRVQRVLRTRSLRAVARCSRRCRFDGRALLRVRGANPIGLALTIASTSPRTATIRMRLSGDAAESLRGALAGGHPSTVTLRVVARGQTGRPARAKETIRITPRG